MPKFADKDTRLQEHDSVKNGTIQALFSKSRNHFAACVTAFACFLVLTLISSGEPPPWIGVADGVSFLASLTSGVVFVFATVLWMVRARAQRKEVRSLPASSYPLPTAETQARVPDGGLTPQRQRGRAILGSLFVIWMVVECARILLVVFDPRFHG